MKYIKLPFVCCLLFVFSYSVTHAQSNLTSYGNSFLIRSDYPSKSVLVSNVIVDKAGDLSPVIGAASWSDSGRQLQCRSLLEFNYAFLPKMIIDNPSMITSAELILFPIQVVFSQEDVNKPSKFIVRRVLEAWEDSATMWMNQPAADSSRQVIKIIKKKEKNQPVSVDVTKLVMEMLRSGNKGFMISHGNPAEKSMALGQLFASPKNEDENLRPLLIIKYAGKFTLPGGSQSVVATDEIIREFDRKMGTKLNRIGTTGPEEGVTPVSAKPPPIKE